MSKTINQLAEEYAIKAKFQCMNCGAHTLGIPVVAWSAGYEARNASIVNLLAGQGEAMDVVEVSMKSYGAGRAQVRMENAALLSNVKDFLNKIEGAVSLDSEIQSERRRLLAELALADDDSVNFK